MQQNSDSELPRLPGAISTLAAGFQFTTSHIWLIVIPVLLDIFYWLGPRLKITGITEKLVEFYSAQAISTELLDGMLELAPSVNLFPRLLSLPVIGVPALMGEFIPDKTPLNPLSYEINDDIFWLLVFVVLSAIGIGLASLYLFFISRSLDSNNESGSLTLGNLLGSFLLAFVRLFGFVIVFMLLFMVLAIPLIPVGLLMAMISPSLFIGAFLIGFIVAVLYLSMTIPGIFLNARPLLKAMRESLKLVFSNLMPTMNLLILIFLISYGVRTLMLVADDGSWITLVSILGHAFISTALVCALFVFYRDRYNFYYETQLSLAEDRE